MDISAEAADGRGNDADHRHSGAGRLLRHEYRRMAARPSWLPTQAHAAGFQTQRPERGIPLRLSSAASPLAAAIFAPETSPMLPPRSKVPSMAITTAGWPLMVPLQQPYRRRIAGRCPARRSHGDMMLSKGSSSSRYAVIQQGAGAFTSAEFNKAAIVTHEPPQNLFNTGSARRWAWRRSRG